VNVSILMPLDFAITALVTLFVVVDPVGLAPTFLAVTEDQPRRARRDVAVRASLIAGAILIGAALLGDLLLRALGISLSAFRIAGGLLLFAIAFEMVLGVPCAAKVKPPKRRSRSMCAILQRFRSPSR
jgi:multiple antibiotic resistance protein